MEDFPVNERGQRAVAEAGRKRQLGTAVAQLTLTVSLIVATVVVLAIAGISGAMAANRGDLLMMEEAAPSSALTTMGILAVIAVVMGVLTVLALRDVAPAHSKRGNRRSVRR